MSSSMSGNTSASSSPSTSPGPGVDGSPGAVLRLVRRHPLAAFLGWFFTVGQVLAFIPVVAEPVTELIPRQAFIVASTLVGLLLPALVVTRITDGPDAARDLVRRAVAWRRPVGWYLLALVLIPVASLLLTAAFSGRPDATVGDVVGALLLGFVLQLILTTLPNNLWEEVAWTGFVQARLQRRHPAAVAALIAGPLFALQHVSLVAGASLVEAVVLLVLLAVLATPFRFLTAWTYNATGSLFLVGLVHGAGNAAAGGSGFGDGMLPRLYPDSGMATSAQLVVSALLGLAVLAATRGQLGLHRRGDAAGPDGGPGRGDAEAVPGRPQPAHPHGDLR